MKVFIVGHGGDYTRMYEQDGWEIVDEVGNADLVQFTGGEDVSPNLYGCGVHPATAANAARDEKEQKLYWYCYDNEIPMVGICRGGQFLNVMCGGRMYQHVNGHATGKTHEVVDKITGYKCNVTSTHHQMMIPANGGSGVRVLGVANPSLCDFKDYVDSEGTVFTVEPEEDDEDTEVLHYPYHRVLCFQPHPEFEDGKECREWFFGLVMRALFGDSTRYDTLLASGPVKRNAGLERLQGLVPQALMVEDWAQVELDEEEDEI